MIEAASSCAKPLGTAAGASPPVPAAVPHLGRGGRPILHLSLGERASLPSPGTNRNFGV